NRYYIFGKEGGKRLAEEYELPFLGQIPIVESIREAGDRGVPAMLGNDEIAKKAITAFASNTVRNIAIRNAHAPKTQPISVS
ncbi:MAG: MRP family ATP-binding protein, partial [Bacteroidetes bacterium]